MEFVGPRWRTICGTVGFWAIGVMLMAFLVSIPWEMGLPPSSLGFRAVSRLGQRGVTRRVDDHPIIGRSGGFLPGKLIKNEASFEYAEGVTDTKKTRYVPEVLHSSDYRARYLDIVYWEFYSGSITICASVQVQIAQN